MEEAESDRRSFRRALLIVAIGTALYGIYCLWQLTSVLDSMSRLPRMTCDDLVQNGPAGQVYISLTDARLSDRRSVSERDSETGAVELYHPIYPSGLAKEPDPGDLKLVLCIMEEGERRRVRDDRNRRTQEGQPGLSEFTCLVREGDSLPDWARSGLAANYPNIRPDRCWVLVVGENEPTPPLVRRLQWRGGISIAVSLAVLAWVWLRRQAKLSGTGYSSLQAERHIDTAGSAVQSS